MCLLCFVLSPKQPIEGVLGNKCYRGVLALENQGVLEEIQKQPSLQNEVFEAEIILCF